MFKNDVEYRPCSYCGKELKEGFVIHLNGVRLQFCNEECMLRKGFSIDRFEDINKENEGDGYYYNWNQ